MVKGESFVRNLARGALCSVFGVVVALALIEVGFRVWNPAAQVTEGWSDRPPFYYAPEGAESFRGPPYSAVKPPGTFRIAVIGDSFAFAPYMQFDDTFGARLERMLNLNRVPLRADVINYGVPRYSTHHEIALVEQALKEQADLILLQVTLNDPEVKPYRPTGLIVGEVNRWGQLELNHPLFSYWRSLGFVIQRLYNSQTPRRYREYFFGLFERKRTFNNFKGSVDVIAKYAHDAKVPIVAVTFPLFGVPLDATYPFLPLHARVDEVMRGAGIGNLDLFDIYRGIPHDRLKVMPLRDFHPNEIAHRLAAERIYEYLAHEKLIPAELEIRRRYRSRVDIRFGEQVGP